MLPVPPIPPSTPAAPGAPAAAPAGAGASGFATALGSAVDSLQQAQASAAQASLGAAAGTTSVADLMVATNEAQLQTQLTVAIQNAAVTAFNKVLEL